MPTLNDATAVLLGSTPAQAVYLGATKVWPQTMSVPGLVGVAGGAWRGTPPVAVAAPSHRAGDLALVIVAQTNEIAQGNIAAPTGPPMTVISGTPGVQKPWIGYTILDGNPASWTPAVVGVTYLHVLVFRGFTTVTTASEQGITQGNVISITSSAVVPPGGVPVILCSASTYNYPTTPPAIAPPTWTDVHTAIYPGWGWSTVAVAPPDTPSEVATFTSSAPPYAGNDNIRGAAFVLCP